MQEMQEMQVQSLGWEDSLKKGMATHSSILTWRIPWTQEPGRLQSLGSQRVGHDGVTEHTHPERAEVWREVPLRSGDFQKRDIANPQPRRKRGE